MSAGAYVSTPQRDWDHEITVDGATVCRDGRRVRVSVDADRKWIRVGCTRVSFAAMRRLFDMTSKHDVEIVLQDGY